MWESLVRVNAVVSGVVWGPVGLALLFGTGCLLTVRTGFFQFRKMGYWLRHTIGAIFTNKDVTAHTSKEDMAISQFQSMCTALAGTIGTGNIVGVATAIVKVIVSAGSGLLLNVFTDPFLGYFRNVYIFGQEYTVAQALTKIAGGVTFVNSVASTVCVVVLYLALRPALERAGLLPKGETN